MKWLTSDASGHARDKRLRDRGWHRWFAWRPVVVGDHWLWLTTVERFRKFEAYRDLDHWIYRERSS